jgi:hypothetical protein
MTKNEESRIQKDPATSTTATVDIASLATHTDFTIDLALVGTDGDLWAQLFNGKFRLAVKCDICGRWLTSHASKSAGRGPSCSARTAKP